MHTAKKTSLTWAGTSGRFSEPEITALGHHKATGVRKTVAAYNLSQLSVPVQKLSELLEDIASGKFHPDAPAGMQWQSASMADAARQEGSAPPNPQLQQPRALGAAEPREAGASSEPARPGVDTDARDPVQARQPGAQQRPVRQRDLGYIVNTSFRHARARYVHIAAPAKDRPESKRRKTVRLRLESPYGPVTNLCDFAIAGAEWVQDSKIGGDRVMCKVCASQPA